MGKLFTFRLPLQTLKVNYFDSRNHEMQLIAFRSLEHEYMAEDPDQCHCLDLSDSPVPVPLRYVFISNDETVSTLGLSLVSGFGGLLGFYIPEYAAAGKGYADITHLMTYPTLFM
jgi:hypothetical protein